MAVATSRAQRGPRFGSERVREALVGYGFVLIPLGLFALLTAVSMAVLSTGVGATVGAARVRSAFHRVAPALGVSSMAFGVWYALGALSLAPYYL